MFIGIFLTFIFLKIKIKKFFLYSLLFSLFVSLTFILNPITKKRILESHIFVT